MKRWLLPLLFAAPLAPAQQLVEWTAGPGILGLGYPVPEPVDTPEPFDGFRTYGGLHARHQDLMMNRANIEGVIVGQTRLERDIWAYRIGDAGTLTPDGRAEPAILIHGGLHAREWQSPEVVTGFMEWLGDHADDGHWGSYLRDHVNIVLLPVSNVDGFLQTQRYPRSNYLGTDPGSPDESPRDGRMRRKNHRLADENLFTTGDHLNGVDLNRNNAPYYPGSPENSNPQNLVYHGPSPGSEPETQALYAAAELGPENRLRFYSDMHSYGRLLFSVRTFNQSRNLLQTKLMRLITQHHRVLPGGVTYSDRPNEPGFGLGTTSEYFAYTYQIPSLTWEIEPGLDGAVEYGGLGNNSHDGFILPEDQIARVRNNLALTLAAVAYDMAGPPSVMRAEIIDAASEALVWQSSWHTEHAAGRVLDRQTFRALEIGRDYRLRLTFDKPMRWREDGEITHFPGVFPSYVYTRLNLKTPDGALELVTGDPAWIDSRDNAFDTYHRYRDDTVVMDFRINDTPDNLDLIQALLDESGELTVGIDVRDMTGRRLDVDPATPVDWSDGRWVGYDDHDNNADFIGGEDRTLSVPVTLSTQPEPEVVVPGHSAMWRDPDRMGEGWVLELLDDGRAVLYWYTYDDDGGQRWLIGVGERRGNRVAFPEMLITSGGRFGPDFDPDDVENAAVAGVTLLFENCDRAWLDFEGFDIRGRYRPHRLSSTMDLDCDPPPGSVSRPEAALSGSWRDPAHMGEGFSLHWLSNDTVLVTWYTYDTEGNQVWLIGVGEQIDGEIVFDNLQTTRGGIFGEGFDPDAVEGIDWGELRISLDCETGGVARWDSLFEEFGSGSQNIERLTDLDGLECPE